MARLRRIDCSGPGIARRRRGRGFEYIDDEGRAVKDPEVVARIRELAIPPAWRDVWVCPYPNGHLQAVGLDAAGRKQYVYHSAWRERRDAEKFDHMLEFARTLPRLRATCEDHLSDDGLSRERVLACAARLLDRGFFRIGTEGYAEQNQTYGLATMQKRHVKLRKDVITFDYVAKSAKRQVHALGDPVVLEVVGALKRRRGGGQELLAYQEGRSWYDVKSLDINLYIQEVMGGEFTAKDFRTWNATVFAAVALGMSKHVADTKTGRKRAISRALQEVAHYLGNTPAVCRASYVDPRVFDRYNSKWILSEAIIDLLGEGVAFGELSTQGPIEEGVLDLIEEKRESPALEQIVTR